MTLRRTLPHFVRLTLVLATSCAGPEINTTPEFDGEPPSVYVAKVKNLLVGLTTTDAEVAAVVADPTALAGLIDTWMATPEYQQKMMVFFELAFQQTQITTANFIDIAPPNGLGAGRSLPLLVQNARESFARTVLGMNGANQPFTSAFETKQLMMTPALMLLYAWFESHQANDAAAVTDLFQKANVGKMITLETSAGPIPLADSLDPTSSNYMHFYNVDVALQAGYPDPLCNNVDPIQVNATAVNMFDVLYGVIPNHKVGTSSCAIRGATGAGQQLVASDFTAWKLVTIRPPNGTEAVTRFYDLSSLRTKSELVLATPRLGFLTPAFFANWPTNASNQMRVTVNQALIVATGAQIDGTDGTTPSSTPGLDAEHAAPGTACFGCHQLLDPTRSILSSTYSWYYNQQTDTALVQQPGMFAFQKVVQPMSTISDFAHLLATHPLVPQAWAQKLCYYANSAPCEPSDPVFQKIVTDFANGNQWNHLVRDLLASPITTNATKTKTYVTNSEVIAVSRRDHLCAQLDNRLGFTDICQLDAFNQGGGKAALAQIITGMPSDGYGRGGVIPVLPNEPTLFYRAGLENICATVSAMVVDGKANPKQPNQKVWVSTDPTTAINEFVSSVVGLTSTDERTAPVLDALTSHFNDAVTGGATKTDALRSTFVAACLSPSFIGIGM